MHDWEIIDPDKSVRWNETNRDLINAKYDKEKERLEHVRDTTRSIIKFEIESRIVEDSGISYAWAENIINNFESEYGTGQYDLVVENVKKFVEQFVTPIVAEAQRGTAKDTRHWILAGDQLSPYNTKLIFMTASGQIYEGYYLCTDDEEKWSAIDGTKFIYVDKWHVAFLEKYLDFSAPPSYDDAMYKKGLNIST